MRTEARVQESSRTSRSETTGARTIGAGASVVLLRPRKLRGTIGVVQRRTSSGWEVEIRSALGTPLHLTLSENALHLR